ncbi:Tfp pilus assembly protein, ATPase PilM [Bacillus methanolicus PB1]|uniref:Tfp pilus assembly protein, ATPase PilM n=1 Tax=Bacillus methanolicus PB1 TaxID=997296 RepID=I3DXS3_BACMT|nr:pilus assembly protein PilM [Bacillus methanolicus]EIJ79044.1 Tfp pilus assembly protein, ATPase PilM [Bacillus methanolicus PB1]
MGMHFRFGNKRTINLTMKDYVIRFAELKQAYPPVISRWGERFLPPGLIKDGKIKDFEMIESILEECVEDWKIAKRPIRFLVPDQFVVIRKISIPADIQDDEIKGYLYMELGTSIHLPFDEPVFDYFPISSSDHEKKEILLFAAPEEMVTEYASLFEQVKLKPAAADISCLALYRLYFEQEKYSENENLMMMHIDLLTVNISIFEGHLPVFMRHLPLEFDVSKWDHTTSTDQENSYSGDSQEVLNPLENIYKEAERVMNFYRYSLNQGNRQITKILIDGDHPWIEEIYKEIKVRFEIPTVTIESRTIEAAPEDRAVSPFHLNIGLGLKEV